MTWKIDAVALSDADRAIVFGECKFWKEPVGANVLRVLEERAGAVDWHRGERKETFALFSVSGFTDELKSIAAARPDVVLVDDSVPA